MHYLTRDRRTFDRAAIMRGAWKAAHQRLASDARFCSRNVRGTLRDYFAAALRNAWAVARAHVQIAARLAAARSEAPAFRGVGRRAARSIPTRAFGVAGYRRAA